MKWLIVTCDASAHIRSVQEWLFKKYAPQAELHYIDVGSEPVETWGRNVLFRVAPFQKTDYKVVFGLDDYLPTAPLNMVQYEHAIGLSNGFRRFELGYGAHNKSGMTKFKSAAGFGHYLMYGPDTPYSASCQFSIWTTKALCKALHDSTTPWNFEVKQHIYPVGCFDKGDEAFRWIEESALSKRWKGKINVNGLPAEDVDDLIALGLLDASKLINRA